MEAQATRVNIFDGLAMKDRVGLPRYAIRRCLIVA
jgi:hypothetical protein